MFSFTGISRGLTSFHMSYQEGQANSSRASGWLSSFLPFWEVCARPSSPLPAARWVGGPAALPDGRRWPQLLGQGEQARLSGREARAGMKRPFMAVQRPSVSTGAWPRGPVVRVSTKQTYLPKGWAAGAVGLGEPTVPRPVSRGPTPPGSLGQSTKSQTLVYSGPCSLGLHMAVADSQLS